MIVITDIRFAETDRDVFQLLHQASYGRPVRIGDEYIPSDTCIELIRGRRFVRPSDGTDILVGMSQQVQDVLGLQYEAWASLQAAYEAERRNHGRTANELYGYKHRVENLTTATLWRRFTWLFTGVKED